MEQGFPIKILDDDFKLVTIINYSGLSWQREYNKSGQFTIEGVVGDFDRTTWKYVYTEKRRELGRIQQVNWKQQNYKQTLTLSGYFLEEDLNRMICYPKPTNFDDGNHYRTSIVSTGSPEWITQDGDADQVAKEFFNGFKQITIRNYEVGDFDGTGGLVTKTFTLPISFGTIAEGEYQYAIHTRNGEYLGDKLYDILKYSNASFNVDFDYMTGTQTLNIVHGTDRTQDGHAYGINQCVFSSKNGTIKTASIVTSNAKTKDAMIQISESNEEVIVLANALPTSTGRFSKESLSTNVSDYFNEQAGTHDDAGYKLSAMANASTRLHSLEDTMNIQYDLVNGSYEYMTDFDLGDTISIVIPEIGINTDAQIISCHETIKNGTWDLNLEVGTPVMRKRGNY